MVSRQQHLVASHDTRNRTRPLRSSDLRPRVQHSLARRGTERCDFRHLTRRGQPREPETRCQDFGEVRARGGDCGEWQFGGGEFQVEGCAGAAV